MKTTRGRLSFPILFALIAMAVVLVACGNGKREAQHKNGRIVLEFWHAMGSGQAKALNEIADAFNKSQDKYFVQTIYQGRYDVLSQKLIASLYAKKNPVMSQQYPGWTARYFEFGYLEPIQNFVDKDPEFKAQISDFYPAMIAENTQADPRTGEQTLVTLPFNKSVYVLYMNQDRMEAAGWKEPPKTWDEMLELAQKMTIYPENRTADSEPIVYGFASRPYIEDFTVQALSADTQLMDEKDGTILIDSEKGRAALDFLHTLVTGKDGKRAGYVESNYLSNVFGSQRIAMYIGSTASFTFNDTSVGTAFVWRAYRVPPRDANTVGKTLMQGTNAGIYKNSTDEEKAGAWEFVKFLVSPEQNAKWAIDTGYMPTRHATLAVPRFAEQMKKDVRYANAVGTLDYATAEPRMIYWESVRQLLNRQVEAIMLNRRKVDDVLKESRSLIEQIKKTTD
ncbi:ABC transporter substrate-binding protein [soil metagenome]